MKRNAFLQQWNRIPKSTWGLVLIITAMLGLMVSYHLTLQARFVALEQMQKQIQDTQANQDEAYAVKLELVSKLDKQMTILQNFLVPLSKMTRNQDAALVDLRDEIFLMKKSIQEMKDGMQRVVAASPPPIDKGRKNSQTNYQKATAKAIKVASVVDPNAMTVSLPQSPGEISAEDQLPKLSESSNSADFSVFKNHMITVPPNN